MRPGSRELAELDRALKDPSTRPGELVCYAQRLDWWIGTWSSAPRGESLDCAAPRGPLSAMISHFTVHFHPSIHVDIARRLRLQGERAHAR